MIFMKTIVFLSALLFCIHGHAQLKTAVKCPDLNIDILSGTVNKKILPSSTVGQIKFIIPCFTSFAEDSTTTGCGGNVMYKDKDVYFYTSRDYVEIGPSFKGTLSLPLMGAKRNSLFRLLGAPQLKDPGWDAFQTQYGVLILYYDKAEKVNKIQFSTQTANTIQLCQ